MRECSLFSIKAWYEGESTELKKWIDFGFFNHIFVSKNGLVRLYYDVEEGEKGERDILINLSPLRFICFNKQRAGVEILL